MNSDTVTVLGGGPGLGFYVPAAVLARRIARRRPVELLVIPESEQTKEAYARAFREGSLSRGPVSKARVIRVDESELTRPGPRVFDALERLAAAMR